MTEKVKIMGFRPIGDKILVLPEEYEAKIGSIKLPDTYLSVKSHVKAKVIAVGGKVTSQIKEGDTVVYKKMYELSIDIDDVKHVILKEEYIDAVGTAE
jgi:co-chaperonin GroES (HSP10)